MKKRKILCLHQGSEYYGSDKIFLQVVLAIRDEFDVLIVLDNDKGPLVEKIRSHKISFFIHDLAVLRSKHFNIVGILRLCVKCVFDILWLGWLINKNRVDIIYSSTIALFIGGVAAFAFRKKHVWHVHEVLSYNRFINKSFSYMVANLSDKVIAVSQSVVDNLVIYSPSIKTKTVVIWNGLAKPILSSNRKRVRECFGISEDDFLVCTVGRIQMRKGQFDLLDAGKLLIDRLPFLKIIIVGDVYPGNEYLITQMKEKVLRNSLQDVVILAGYRSDVYDIMAASDVFVFASRLPESFGLVVLEAMAVSIPVIATRLGGVTEIIEDGVNGILISPQNPQQIADAVLTIFEDKELIKKMTFLSKSKFETHFSLESFNNKLRKILTEL